MLTGRIGRYTYVAGSDLSPDTRAECLRTYVNRFTREHIPAWARQPRPDGRPHHVQFASDAEWLANSAFPVTKAGRLSGGARGHCFSNPTWPDRATAARAMLAALKEAKTALQPIMTTADRKVFQQVTAAIAAAEAAGITTTEG